MTACLFNGQNGPLADVVDAFVYPQFLYAQRAPTTQDIYNPGTRWQDASVNPPVIYQTSGAGVWATAGSIFSILGTANQITVTTVGGVATLSIPAVFIAPGSIASTTTLTGGTGITATTGNITASTGNIVSTLGSVAAATTVTAGTTITATLGNITATNGNFVASTAGTGILLNSGAATGAAASPVVLNGRSGQVVFTSVSIAAAADLTLTITNSAITASTTQVLCQVSGATTGAALSVKSKTSSTGSLALVITNGTGATTSTSDITVTFLVLNT